MHAHHDYFRARSKAPNCLGGLQAGHYGHAHIKKDEVRLQPERLLDSFLTIFRFAANLKTGVAQHVLQSSAHDLMVVYEEHSPVAHAESAPCEKSRLLDSKRRCDAAL